MILTLILLLAAALYHVAASPVTLKPRAATAPIWPSQHYYSEHFTAPDMKVSRSGDTQPGYLFLTPFGNGTTVNAPVIMTDSNELIWAGPSTGYTYNNFKVQQLHDQPVLTSWYGNSSATFGHGYGAIAIWNTSYAELYNICPSGLGILTPNYTKYDCYLDQHESYLTDQGTVIASAYNVTQKDLTSVGGPSNGWIFDSLFYEIDVVTQKVLFRWRSLDHQTQIPITDSQEPLKLYGSTFGSSEILPWDYFHINSVQPLSDGYLVNSRHLYSMYKVSKTTGNVEWHLSGIDGGDFTLDPDIYFSWQHMPRISNATNSSMYITLFNNDNSEAQASQVNGSTGLCLFVDFETMHVSLDRKLQNTSEVIVAGSQGSYQSLDQGHVLLGYGQIATTREFDATGKVVYEAQYGYSNASSMVASYRSYRQSWDAQPAAAPKLAVACTEDISVLYMSWNGATAYTSWTVYAGNSSETLLSAGTVLRDGFETQYTVENAAQYAMVVAEVNGTALGKSATVGIAC